MPESRSRKHGAHGACSDPWPELPTAAWRETYETLHLWTQIVGKIRLARSPWLNHSWHVALYVTARGLTTSPIPDGTRDFQIDFDFIDHALRISTSDGAGRQLALAGQSVASFYAAVMADLAGLGIAVAIDEMPNELPEPIRFSQDNRHAVVRPGRGAAVFPDPRQRRPRVQAVPHRLPRQGEPGAFLLGQFRSRGDALFRPPRAAPSRRRAASAGCGRLRGLFARGEQRRLLARQRRDRLSRVLFLCLSGARRLSRHQGAPRGGVLQRGARRIHFALRRGAQLGAPEQALLDFLQSTYEAAANAAKWDRDALECAPGRPGVVREIPS